MEITRCHRRIQASITVLANLQMHSLSVFVPYFLLRYADYQFLMNQEHIISEVIFITRGSCIIRQYVKKVECKYVTSSPFDETELSAC